MAMSMNMNRQSHLGTEMSRRAIEYNNAGVDCFHAGHHEVAWDLFKAALEIRMGNAFQPSAALSQVHQHSDGNSLAQAPPSQPQQTQQPALQTSTKCGNAFVERAEHHLARLAHYLHSERTPDEEPSVDLIDTAKAIRGTPAPASGSIRHHVDAQQPIMAVDSDSNAKSNANTSMETEESHDSHLGMMGDATDTGSESRTGMQRIHMAPSPVEQISGTFSDDAPQINDRSPFLCKEPIRLYLPAREQCGNKPHDATTRDDATAEACPSTQRNATVVEARRDIAAAIFNLALLDHLRNPWSGQVAAMYELAMTVLTGDQAGILGLSLVNNIGVWCFQNGNVAGAVKCMRHLLLFLNGAEGMLKTAQKEGIYTNIVWMLSQPMFASPAA